MAAAAIASLKQKIVRLLNPSQSKIALPRSELESIFVDLSYWQSFLQIICSGQMNDRANALQTQIEDLAQKFEYMIESHISDWNRLESVGFGDVNLAFGFFQKIVELKPKINSLTKTLESERGKHKISNQQPSSFFAAESDTTKMVGLVDELEELKARVLGGDYRIISIVGMAGIGKTTLAKELFYNPICLNHFQIRLFLTVGPQYQPRQFLLLALVQLGSHKDKMGGKKFAELKEHLILLLDGKRYLIVLDDIWDIQVWHEIRILFPDFGNGSRIIMTTRLLNVAGHPSSDMLVPFLNDDESWDLLRKMVFTSDQESSLWDHQLEKIGRKIAKNCEGLPLAIIEVGKLLCKTDRTVESWMEIAEREDPLVIKMDDGTLISNTLSLSYIKLPPHLKSCFLYMGVFPKNFDIPTIKLINLWISEGFITQPSISNKSLEKVSEGCLDDLVSRSLVLVCKGSSSGRIKTCRIHFVYRNICISEAKNEKLFNVIKKYPNSFPEGQMGLCFHNNSVLGFKQVHRLLEKSDSDPRSLLVFGPQHQHPLRLYLHFPSLGILDAVNIRFYKFPHQVVELVELRYLAITYDGEIPPSICGLCNLEVLIVRRHHESLKSSLDTPVYLPIEVWELKKLRHLQCIGYDLPDPTKDVGSNNCSHVILENLSTLSGVSAHSCYRGVLERMPNLTKLGFQNHDYFSLCDQIKYVDRLESFKCIVKNPRIGDWYVTDCPYTYYPYFPVSIRKIALCGCGFSWPSMTHLWNLPKLEVLKLRRYAFCGPEWHISEWGCFAGLKFLLLEDLDIEHWSFDFSCFPILRHLIIRHCYKLRDIPCGLGYRSSLQMLEVDDCSPSLVISAQQIQKLQQQHKNAYKSFQLRIHSSWDDKKSVTPRPSAILMADAALEFLLENLQQLLIYHAHLISDTRNQVERLEKDLRLLKDFLNDFSKKCRNDNSLRELITQIHDVVYEVEDVIDAFVTQATKTRSRNYFLRALRSPVMLRTIAKEVEAVGFKVRDIYCDKSRLDFATVSDGGEGPQVIDEAPMIVRQDKVVGFDDEAETIVGYLNEETQQLDVISIIGIPGLGKTTLARKIFRDPAIQFEFPTRIWVYVSQEFTKKDIFLAILREFTRITNDMYCKSDQDLACLVASHLERKKFLIVMDDVRTEEDWEKLQIALPKHNKIGKVLITSRNMEVAHFANRDRHPHRLRFLTQDESWLLLQLEVFGKPGCPYDLEGYGKLIVDKCRCLPLAIVVIGGILIKRFSTSDEMSAKKIAWKKVSDNVSMYLSVEDLDRRTKITMLSYSELPYHLRTCFLYFGIFPEDFEIPVWKLIRMWIAEGFIQHKVGCTLEETAESYLDDLIRRNLVRVDKKNPHGKAKTCRIHDMFREFCKTEGGNDRVNFLQEMKRSDDGGFEPSVSEVHNYRRICIHSNVLNFISSMPYGPRVRSFACFSKDEIKLGTQIVSHIPDAFMLLRVLEAKPMKFTKVPSKFYQLVHLKYITLSFNITILPSHFSKLWNLQTLVVETTPSRTLKIKADIWKMFQLRHLKTNVSATIPKTYKNGKGGENLQTLDTISPQSCTNKVFNRIRNLKRLGIRGHLSLLPEVNSGSFDNLVHLSSLEKLRLMNDAISITPSEGKLHVLPQHYKFPSKLKSLTLSQTHLEWRQMSILGLLDNLEVLKLKEKAFMGKSWEGIDEGFRRLEVLHIGRTNLVVWVASHHNFPRLRRLELRNCDYLRRIPIGLADVPSLQLLDVFHSRFAAASAMEIRDVIQIRRREEKIAEVGAIFKLSIFPPVE